MPPSIITPALMDAIRGQYRLDWHGIHGVAHWQRVRSIGLALAEKTGADGRVIELFAFLHDSCRHNDSLDPGHGARAAEFALSLRGRCFELEDDKFDRLIHAIARHTAGSLDMRADVGSCWDADRLDLGRVSISPQRRFLSTAAARERDFFEWATAAAL